MIIMHYLERLKHILALGFWLRLKNITGWPLKKVVIWVMNTC